MIHDIHVCIQVRQTTSVITDRLSNLHIYIHIDVHFCGEISESKENDKRTNNDLQKIH